MHANLLTTVTHQAMATNFAVLLPPCQAEKTEAVMEALEKLDEIESRLTVYRDSSEVSRINRQAADAPVQVSSDTFALLKRSIQWSERTAGAFDVTAGPLIKAWGFLSRSGRKPTDEEIQAATECVGYQHLMLDEDQQTVAFAKPGMSINLGAIGKGDALDQLASMLTDRGVDHFLLHGGKSSIVGRGSQQPESEASGWAVGISHPTKPSRRVAGIWLQDKALATSGSGKQFFHHHGQRYGHVIDPRTGYPSGDMLSLTVVTESAADADACATGYFVAGSESVQKAHENQSDMPPMVCLNAGRRQDEVTTQSYGTIDWIDNGAGDTGTGDTGTGDTGAGDTDP